MKHSFKIGFGFGSTSGIITTLGLIIGLNSGTHSKITIIGGVLTIAIADSFSDALGIHISEESENVHTSKEIWMATFSTFFFKFAFALTFLVPLLILPITQAVIVSIIWGFFLIATFSYYIAREQKNNAFGVIFEHLFIAIVVIALTHIVGSYIGKIFGGIT